MVLAFDTLGYAKRLRDGGVPEPQAEAHAEAARDYIMVELVTKTDLAAAAESLRRDMDARFENLHLQLDGLRRDVDAKIERLSLQLTVRLGALMVAGLGALAVIQHLH